MKFDIKNRTEIIETRNVYQLNIEINNKLCSIKKEETHSGYDIYVLFDDIGFWIDIYDVKDIELRNQLNKIGYNMHSDLFKTESNDVDIDTLPDSNKLK